MKLPFGVKLIRGDQNAEARARVRAAMTREVGAAGVRFMSGLIVTDEFNDSLTGQDAVLQYDKMRRTDAQVESLIKNCQLPLMSAAHDVDRPDNEEQADKITDEHLAFARDNLFRRIDFSEFLAHALSCLWAGFSICEIVWKVEDGRIVLAKLAPRLASTVDEWNTDENGALKEIVQYVYKGDKYEHIPLPRNKIALFTFGREANNYQGISLLRAVYKHWFIKDALYRLDAIRCERYAVGIPAITLPEEYDDDTFDMAINIGRNWKGGAQSHVVLTPGMDFKIVSVSSGEALDLMGTINHHNEEIAKVGLVQFINLGQTETGSRALGEVTTAFFYDAEQGLAEQICGVINADILWPLMDANFPGEIRPVMKFSDIGAVGLGELTSTLSTVGPQYLPPNLDLENALRDRLKLPRRTPEEVEEQKEEEAERQAAQAPPVQQEAPPLPGEGGEFHVHLKAEDVEVPAESDFWRPLRPAERHIALRQMSGMIDDTRDRMLRLMISARDQWLAALGSQLTAAIPKGPQAIGGIRIPKAMVDGVYSRILPVLDDVYDYGEDSVGRELMRMSEDVTLRDTAPKVREISDLLRTRARLMIDRLSRKTEDAIVALGLDLFRTKGPEAFGDSDVELVLQRAKQTVESDARVTAVTSVSEAMNLGRGAAADANSERIKYCEYSAILDRGTCTQCSSVDGRRVTLGSEEYYDLTPPLRSGVFGQCDGRDRCRCIWVYVMAEGR